jgi:hypothetical protein
MFVKVFHRKETDFRAIDPPDPNNLTWAASVAVGDVVEVFQATNSIMRPWWENRNVIGAATRSTSVGDIYHAKADYYDNGLWYMVLPCGLERIKPAYPSFASNPLYLNAIRLIESWLSIRTSIATISAEQWEQDYADRAQKMANDLHWFTSYFYPDSPLIGLMVDFFTKPKP